MDRRRFIAACAATSGFVAFGGYVVVKFAGQHDNGALEASLCPLYRAQFKVLADQYTKEELLLSLSEKRVLSRSTALDVLRVSELAQSDEMRAYDRFYYTTTELQVYALAYKFGRDGEGCV